MALVQMKCPNCGSAMNLKNNQFACPNCRTMILNIVDAKIDADVTVISPEEFAKKIEETKRQFVINIDDHLEVFDVQTKIINKRIADATELLQSEEYAAVFSALTGVPNNVLSAERLRFLAGFKVQSEYELSFYNGYIDVIEERPKYTKPNEHYENILRLADEQTRKTYVKLAEHCREQYDTKKRIEKEIKEVQGLLDVELYDDAITYAAEMCRRYPHTMLSWAYLCTVKYNINYDYNCKSEYAKMQKCSDYEEHKLPDFLKEKMEIGRKTIKDNEKIKLKAVDKLLRFGGCLVLYRFLFPIFELMGLIKENTLSPFAGLLYVCMFIASLVLFIITIVGSISVLKARNSYRKAIEIFSKKELANLKTKNKKIKIRFAIGIILIATTGYNWLMAILNFFIMNF